MKKYLYIAITVGVLILTFTAIYQNIKLNKYKALYEKELQNVKAYQVTNSNLEDNIRQYQMSMNDLRASKDSLDKRLLKVVDSLKIKDKKIEYLQYQTKIAQRVDTIQTLDTIFVPKVHIDTLIGNPWYSLNLKLNYPSTIIVKPTFKSEQYAVISTKKEFNNTPSKIFFIRWFQKKHTIVEVNMEEKSPYIENKESKFIKIIK